MSNANSHAQGTPAMPLSGSLDQWRKEHGVQVTLHHCQRCKTKPVIVGSKEATYCSGNYPFQCCCVCAVYEGWKGWEDHACAQCKASTPSHPQSSAAGAVEFAPHDAVAEPDPEPEDHEDTRDHHDGAKYEEATQREHVDSFASPQKKWKEVESVSAFRSGSRPLHLPQAMKSPQLPTNMKQDSQKTSSEASGASRTPVPPKNKSLTWQPGGSEGTRGRDDDEDAEDEEKQRLTVKLNTLDAQLASGTSDSDNIAKPSEPSVTSQKSSRFNPRFGPPPPPLDCAQKIFNGEQQYPSPNWGDGYLVILNGARASAKYGGGGSIDVPVISSTIEVPGPTGRGYWEIRVDKKIGLLKFGLGHFHDEAPGDPGLKMGDNWTDRKGNGCTWYLESHQGDTFEGTKCLTEGPVNHEELQLLPGDVVSAELINGKASFYVNYKPYSTDITITKWPVKMCVLFVFQGDQVTLLRNEYMQPDELSRWMQSRDERGEQWKATTHARLGKEGQLTGVDKERERERERAREEAKKRERLKLEMERERVEAEIAEHDRRREERKRERELREGFSAPPPSERLSGLQEDGDLGVDTQEDGDLDVDKRLSRTFVIDSPAAVTSLQIEDDVADNVEPAERKVQNDDTHAIQYDTTEERYENGDEYEDYAEEYCEIPEEEEEFFDIP